MASNLEQRLTAAPARTDTSGGAKTIFDLIKASEKQFAVALGRTIDPERFVRVALTTVRTNPSLAGCNPQSLLAALMLSAQLGLEPGGPLGHAYLVPFKNEVTFIPGYRGLITLARRSGEVASIRAHAVFDGDEFSSAKRGRRSTTPDDENVETHPADELPDTHPDAE